MFVQLVILILLAYSQVFSATPFQADNPAEAWAYKVKFQGLRTSNPHVLTCATQQVRDHQTGQLQYIAWECHLNNRNFPRLETFIQKWDLYATQNGFTIEDGYGQIKPGGLIPNKVCNLTKIILRHVFLSASPEQITTSSESQTLNTQSWASLQRHLRIEQTHPWHYKFWLDQSYLYLAAISSQADVNISLTLKHTNPILSNALAASYKEKVYGEVCVHDVLAGKAVSIDVDHTYSEEITAHILFHAILNCMQNDFNLDVLENNRTAPYNKRAQYITLLRMDRPARP